MTEAKILEVVQKYDKKLASLGIRPVQHDSFEKCQGRREAFEHIRSMIPKIGQFIKEERIEKAFRWLGWIQGTLWAFGMLTLEEEKNDNRPPERII